MQNTLLGLAIAIILALTAALVGPLFVDWDQYRTAFESHASEIVGLPVRVTGPIKVRLLPTPSLVLNGIELGRPGEADSVRAQKLAFEFALGPLMRGQFRVSETHLVGPQFDVALDRTGHVHWPALAVGFNPDSVAIEHLSIEDGRVVLSDAASGARAVLDKLWFTGAVASLAGPFKGEGAFVNRGEAYGYRIAAGRVEDDGGLHLRLGLEPADRPSMSADGSLFLQDATPRFEGTFAVMRPAGLARASGHTLLDEPWKISAHVRATPAAALFEQAEFQYGSEERGFKLTGTAQLQFGARPRLNGVFTGRQIDLDRAIAMPELTGQPPLAAVKAIAANFAGMLHPPLPMQIGLTIDALTFGGATLQAFGGDVTVAPESLNFDRLEFRAPGFAQVEATGRLDLTSDGIAGFSGPVSIDASDPRAFAAWLEGRGEPGESKVQNLHARGDVTLAQDKLQVERLKLEFEHQTIAGRLAYIFATHDHPVRLEADLQVPELDADQALAFAQSALGGTTFERPQEIALAVAVGHATIAGIDLRQADARLRIDGNSVQVDRLAVGDLGGTSFQASGGIDGLPNAPRGKLTLDLDARSLAGAAAVLARFAPEAADPIRRLGDRLVPARLHGTLSIEGAPATTAAVAKLGLDGQAGVLRFSIQGEESGGDVLAMTDGEVRLEGKIEADDGSALASLAGADRFLAVDNRPAKLIFAVKGPLNGELRVDGRIAATGLDGSAVGTVRLTGKDAPSAAVKLAVTTADARPLRRQLGRADPLPVAFSGQLSVTPGAARIDGLNGKIAGMAVRGHLTAALGHPTRIDGAIETDAVDASAAIASAVGLPAQGGARSELALWSAEPFAPWLYSNLSGQVAIKAARATFTPALVARDAQAVLRLSPSELAIDDLKGTLAGGRLTGQLTVRSSSAGIAASGRVGLSNADAAALITAAGKPPVTGRFGLQVEAAGEGLSPVALIGSVSGGGTLTFERSQLAGLDPKVFDTLTRTVDKGTTLDGARVRDIVGTAFDAGRLGVPQLEAALAINAGHGRVGTTIVPANGAELAVSGDLDLNQGTLDARLTLSGAAGPDSAGQRPDVTVSLKGPLGAPKRTLDVSALAGWLTLRAVDEQARRLEAAEAKRREIEAAETKRREAEAAAAAAEAKRRESALNTDQTTSDAIGEDARRGARRDENAPTAPAQHQPENTGTATAPGTGTWLGTVAPARGLLPPGLEPLPAPIEIRPAPAPHKPAAAPSHAQAGTSASPRTSTAAPRPPRSVPGPTTPAAKRPGLAAPLNLNPSAIP